jgi:hypothetical protein
MIEESRLQMAQAEESQRLFRIHEDYRENKDLAEKLTAVAPGPEDLVKAQIHATLAQAAATWLVAERLKPLQMLHPEGGERS